MNCSPAKKYFRAWNRWTFVSPRDREGGSIPWSTRASRNSSPRCTAQGKCIFGVRNVSWFFVCKVFLSKVAFQDV